MSEEKMKEIRYDVMLSLYHDLPKEQYQQFKGLRLLKESIQGKTISGNLGNARRLKNSLHHLERLYNQGLSCAR